MSAETRATHIFGTPKRSILRSRNAATAEGRRVHALIYLFCLSSVTSRLFFRSVVVKCKKVVSLVIKCGSFGLDGCDVVMHRLNLV